MRRYGSRESDSGGMGSFSPHSNYHSEAKDSGGGGASSLLLSSAAAVAANGPNSTSSHTSTYSGTYSTCAVYCTFLFIYFWFGGGDESLQETDITKYQMQRAFSLGGFDIVLCMFRWFIFLYLL